MKNSKSSCTENTVDFIALQVRFGFSYVEEARSAYAEGRSEYGNLARQIASNAHSAASRLAARLPYADATELAGIARLKRELDALTHEPHAVRSIA